ncbi:hypothetical protein F8388_001086 [Cannabis sativa]|uniref:Peptide deformylase n=1 Tax=Cannabis sativa TaxID=3483 RepID=A0A7J6EFC4_CANSA|nr:hypothetical protein F8388_001086 [Cannabis sativa]
MEVASTRKWLASHSQSRLAIDSNRLRSLPQFGSSPKILFLCQIHTKALNHQIFFCSTWVLCPTPLRRFIGFRLNYAIIDSNVNCCLIIVDKQGGSDNNQCSWIYGNPIKIDASGWQACILQHECDDLERILYADTIVPRTFRTVENLDLPLPNGCPKSF